MTRRSFWMKALVGVGCCGALGSSQAAQEPPPPTTDPGLAAAPQPVTVLVSDRPLVTVDWDGDQGPIKLLGTLEQGPEGMLSLSDGIGRRRQVRWTEIEALAPVTEPSAGLPLGAYSVGIVSEPGQGFEKTIRIGGYSSSSGGSGANASLASARGPASDTVEGWRLMRLPAGGSITVTGEPYGSVTIPLDRVRSYQMAPIRGGVQSLPPGDIRLELVPGASVSIPLPRVVFLRRDRPRGTIFLVLEDGQQFNGREVEFPRITLELLSEVDEKAPPTRVELARVVQLNRTPPGGGR
ncbi:MAG: hypothetical protein FJX77_15280 [Armatimonadetes bacterium]|nr:hypothetical protein [Armatimonadota bacterium]